MGIIEKTLGVFENAGAPSNGVSAVQTLTIGGTPTGGSFKLAFDGHTSGTIAWSATNVTLLANIQAALDALASIGVNGCVAAAGTLTNGIGSITLTFGENLAKLAVPAMSAISNLTGTAPTLAIAETTAGVTATARGARKSALLLDSTNGTLYINKGSELAPIWTLVGTIGSGELVTAMLAAKAVTGVKLDEAALNGLVFTGAAAAGACTLTGAKVGDKVVSLTNLTDSNDGKAAFESTITVADQIQQTSASDLHLKKFSVLLVVKS